MKDFPEESHQFLQNIDTWIVDSLRHEAAPTHSHLEQTLGWIEKFKPRRAILTHMSPHLDYDELVSILPKNIEPAYDGLVIEL